MKFGQLEHKRNTFLKILTEIVVEILFQDPFLKIQN